MKQAPPATQLNVRSRRRARRRISAYATPAVAMPEYIPDQEADALENSPILTQPPQIVLPLIRIPYEQHGSVGVHQLVLFAVF